jgi:hypothetical protein
MHGRRRQDGAPWLLALWLAVVYMQPMAVDSIGHSIIVWSGVVPDEDPSVCVRVYV